MALIYDNNAVVPGLDVLLQLAQEVVGGDDELGLAGPEAAVRGGVHDVDVLVRDAQPGVQRIRPLLCTPTASQAKRSCYHVACMLTQNHCTLVKILPVESSKVLESAFEI